MTSFWSSVTQRWLPCVQGSELAQRLDLREAMVDGRDPIERFIQLSGTNDDYAYGRRSPPWGITIDLLPFFVVFT
jgi:hypothetical protein